MPTPSLDRYAVIGHPVTHSQSPWIHTQFAAQTKQAMCYEKISAPLDDFVMTVQQFHRAGGRGLNITVPFKRTAATYATRLTPRAAQAGAVNTLVFNQRDDGHGGHDDILGDNTDGVGLIRDLTERLQHTLTARRVLLIGAGGAARGVLGLLLEQAPTCLVIANRTLENAQHLVQSTAKNFSLPIQASSFAALAGQTFDIVINASASSLHATVPPLPAGIYAPHALAYDMMYAAQPTCFMQAAQQLGATQVSDGLGMLVEQAAESFYLWRGVRPDTAPVLAGLRQILTQA